MRQTGRALLEWRLGDRKTQRLLAILLVFLATMFAFVVGIGASQGIHGDFFAMWMFARFALTHPAAGLYDREALHAFQLLLDPAMTGYLPFPYPPFTIFLLAPLGWLAITPAWAIWSAAGLAAFLAAAFAPRLKSDAVLFLAFAPATVMSLLSGQNGMLSAALMVGGARLMAARPMFAGLCFGLLAFKPQVGLLIPVALIAAGAWRCFATATITVAALAAAATASFGAAIWPAWIATMRQHWAGYVVEDYDLGAKMPTITENLKLLGLTPSAAEICQLLAAMIAAIIVWRCFRHGITPWAIALLLVGNFIATPYALFYDLPPISFAVLLAVREGPWHLAEVMILLLAFVMPYALLVSAVPLGGLAMLMLFGILARKGEKEALLFLKKEAKNF